MSSFPINSFKYGLDTRRDVLDAQAGTLAVLENGFINVGGEIEKRKAFDIYASVDMFDSNGEVAYFGLESTDDGIVSFTSALEFGASVTQGQPTLFTATPAGIVRMQLVHPSLVNDSSVTYDNTKHRLTGVPFSFTYRGKAFAAGTFSDGRTFLYYDGDLIQNSANGIALDGRLTLADLGEDLARQFDAIGWDATENVDENGATQNGSVMVNSPQSNYFSALNSETSTLGYFGNRLISQDIAETPGVRAVAGFQITANTGPFVVEAPNQASATTPTIDLCGGPVTALGTAVLTATAIVAAINDLTSVHGYSAIQITATANIYVYAPLGYDVSVPIDLTVTGATTAAPGVSVSGMFAVLTPANPSIERVVATPGTYNVGGNCSAVVSGATGTLAFAWSEVTGGTSGITLVNPTNASSIAFRKALVENTSVTGNFQCVITETPSGNVITSYLTITLICTYNSGG